MENLLTSMVFEICDDAINEYMTANNRGNKLLEINLECGGNMPPRIIVNGIRAERPKKHDNEAYCDISQTSQVREYSWALEGNYQKYNLS